MHAVLLADPSEPRIARVDALGDEANYHWLCEMAQILRRARGARAQRQLNPSGPLTATRLQMDVIVPVVGSTMATKKIPLTGQMADGWRPGYEKAARSCKPARGMIRRVSLTAFGLQVRRIVAYREIAIRERLLS